MGDARAQEHWDALILTTLPPRVHQKLEVGPGYKTPQHQAERR